MLHCRLLVEEKNISSIHAVWSNPIHTYQKTAPYSIQYIADRQALNLHIAFADSQLYRYTICLFFSYCGLVFETISQGENAYSWLGYVQPINGVCRWTQARKQLVPFKCVNAPDCFQYLDSPQSVITGESFD